jgi:hypothetical protein
MRVSAVTPFFIAASFLTGSIAAGQSSPGGAIRGAVIDSSGAVLPGVTVTAAAADGQLLATTVTDGSGVYAFPALPAGDATLTFQLEGFAQVSTTLVVTPRGESRAMIQRLELASLSETVVVRAPRPVDQPRPRFDPPPAPPPLVANRVPEHDRAAVCGPAKPEAIPDPPLGTIRARRHETQGELYLTGAELVIDGGLNSGLLVGRNLVVRRHYHVRGTSADAIGEHTAGLVQIVSASERSSVAVVVYACDDLRKGDFLASFKPEPIRDPEPQGTPAYYDAARILFADEGQTLGAPQRQMVIDRGSAHGVRAGQRFTLFRQPGGPAAAIRRRAAGDAVVVAVRPGSATIRIDHVTDAITAGDGAAPQSVNP